MVFCPLFYLSEFQCLGVRLDNLQPLLFIAQIKKWKGIFWINTFFFSILFLC